MLKFFLLLLGIPISNHPIGIFDSGVGGLGILQAVSKLLPAENLIYLADSAFTPYGSKSEQQITQRVMDISDFLISKQVKAIVVACNTATAAAVSTLREKYSIPVIGLEPALKPASESSKSGKIGVLATQATLNSKKYADLKSKLALQLQVVEKASPLFVELVEVSPRITEQEFALIEKELKPFKQAKIDSLVLGCTHYPFLTEAISKIMGPRVRLYESSLPVAKELQRRLENNLNETIANGEITYYSSDPEAAQSKFDRILNQNTPLLFF